MPPAESSSSWATAGWDSTRRAFRMNGWACASRSWNGSRVRAATPRCSPGPGEGTLVTLRWPDERSTTAPEFADFEPAIDGDASELT